MARSGRKKANIGQKLAFLHPAPTTYNGTCRRWFSEINFSLRRRCYITLPLAKGVEKSAKISQKLAHADCELLLLQ
jgi:hypothetical protein